MKQLKHRYCRCRPLVVTFVYYEFGPLSCATKLTKVPHYCTNYCRDWNCSPVISHGDICNLISWHLSFLGCKRHQAARPDCLVLLCSAMKTGNRPTTLVDSDKFFNLQKGIQENNTELLRKNYNSNKNLMGAAHLRPTWWYLRTA